MQQVSIVISTFNHLQRLAAVIESARANGSVLAETIGAGSGSPEATHDRLLGKVLANRHPIGSIGYEAMLETVGGACSPLPGPRNCARPTEAKTLPGACAPRAQVFEICAAAKPAMRPSCLMGSPA
jgi:hypothetical protein